MNWWNQHHHQQYKTNTWSFLTTTTTTRPKIFKIRSRSTLLFFVPFLINCIHFHIFLLLESLKILINSAFLFLAGVWGKINSKLKLINQTRFTSFHSILFYFFRWRGVSKIKSSPRISSSYIYSWNLANKFIIFSSSKTDKQWILIFGVLLLLLFWRKRERDLCRVWLS